MARRKITATMLDGTTHEAVSQFMPLADRVAFERRFGVSTAVLTKHANLFDKDGKAKPGVDLTVLDEDLSEHHAFLSWSVLNRGGCAVGAFDEFIENCESIDIGPREDGGVDPTIAEAQPGN